MAFKPKLRSKKDAGTNRLKLISHHIVEPISGIVANKEARLEQDLPLKSTNNKFDKNFSSFLR